MSTGLELKSASKWSVTEQHSCQRSRCSEPYMCVLLRFREGLHAFVGDVSKMYNSVFLEDKEVHLQRFLWPSESTGEIYETYAILRVNIGDQPAACLAMLATSLTAHLPEFSDMHKPVDTILRSMYVDDILDSVDCSAELETLKSDVEHILARGGFKIKMWLTSDKATVISQPNALKGNESTALGFGYNVEEDILYVRSSINFSRKIQKLHTGPDLKYRCFRPYLVTFSDGSDDAFGAVVYVRWEADGELIIRLIEAKGKLCSLNLKGDTVRSKMCGAVTVARLSVFIEQNSRIMFTKILHFVDSKTVLGAIDKESCGFSTFYANRICEIRSSTSPENWFWISSKDNPDVLDTTPEQLKHAKLWQSDPEWLKINKSEWPISAQITEECEAQVLKLQRKSFTSVITRVKSLKQQDLDNALVRGIPATIHLHVLTKVQISNFREILRIENHSSFKKLQSAAAFRALAHAWKSCTRPISRNIHGLLILPLSPDEIQDAETLLYRISQLDLENNESLAKLVPFEDKTTGLLVTIGRIGSDMGSTVKVPIIPAGHVAKLLAL